MRNKFKWNYFWQCWSIVNMRGITVLKRTWQIYTIKDKPSLKDKNKHNSNLLRNENESISFFPDSSCWPSHPMVITITRTLIEYDPGIRASGKPRKTFGNGDSLKWIRTDLEGTRFRFSSADKSDAAVFYRLKISCSTFREKRFNWNWTVFEKCISK